MMNEVTWHEHCSNLKVKEGGGLVCPVCRIVIDVRGVFSTLAKWGGYKASGGETAEVVAIRIIRLTSHLNKGEMLKNVSVMQINLTKGGLWHV